VKRSLFGIPLVVALAVLAAGVTMGGAAIACKARLDCHLHAGDNRPWVDVATRPLHDEIALPSGFHEETVASGLVTPTAFAVLPDGRFLVAERAGVVRVVDHGQLVRAPALDLRTRVSTEDILGLVALAVDPAFSQNHFLYAVYAVKQRRATPSPTFARVSRFVLTGTRVEEGSERVLLGTQGVRGASCDSLPATADCLPANVAHIGAGIAFDRHGLMFVSTGDGGGSETVEATAFRAQDPDALGGKVLRITRDGLGVAANPYFTGNPADNRSKVWAIGLRSPFRLTLAPRSGIPVVGDVGWDSADEIDTIPAGTNLGWPCYEGNGRTPKFRASKQCRSMYRSRTRVRRPLVSFTHPRASSLTGGVFCHPCAYPEPYAHSYFFGDFLQSWIRRLPLDGAGALAGRSVGFATAADGPVEFRVGPGRTIYYIALNAGELRRLVHTA
jgi:glucose/arabinose dehydrogenase